MSVCVYWCLYFAFVFAYVRHPGGYYQITGRLDDVINVTGHRLGTAEVEDVIVSYSFDFQNFFISLLTSDLQMSLFIFFSSVCLYL